MDNLTGIPGEVQITTEEEQQQFLNFVDREARSRALRDVPKLPKTGCKWTKEERIRNNKRCVRRSRHYRRHRQQLLEDELRKLSLEEARLEQQTAVLDQCNSFLQYTQPSVTLSDRPLYQPLHNSSSWHESSSAPVQPYDVQEGHLDDDPQPEHSNHNLDYWSGH